MNSQNQGIAYCKQNKKQYLRYFTRYRVRFPAYLKQFIPTKVKCSHYFLCKRRHFIIFIKFHRISLLISSIIQHILNKYPIPFLRVVYQHMRNRPDQLPILKNGRTGKPLHNSSCKAQEVFIHNMKTDALVPVIRSIIQGIYDYPVCSKLAGNIRKYFSLTFIYILLVTYCTGIIRVL